MRYYRKNRYIKPKKIESPASVFERRVLASAIISTLAENDFVRCERLETKFGDNSEVVFVKPLPENKRYLVAVYTSCNQAGGAYIARAKGKDAIRVAGLYIKKDGSTVGVIKNKRVNRTASTEAVCKRMAARVASSFVNLKTTAFDDQCKCDNCGAPLFTSKKGNQVCSDLCWRKS